MPELDTLVLPGLASARPAAADAVWYFATDTGVMSHSDGATWTDMPIKAAGTTFAATDRLLGRDSSGAGAGEEIAPSAVRAMLDLEPGTDFPSLSTFDDHSARHEAGGADAVVAGILQSSVATRTAGDLTTNSTSFIDATGLTVTLTTGAHRCLVLFRTALKNSANNGNTAVDIAVDGTLQGQTYGLALYSPGTAGTSAAGPIALAFLTGVLSAGSHTIKIQWRVDGGTGTLFASTSVIPATLTVIETGLTV